MNLPLLTDPPAFYAVAMAILLIVLVAIGVGRAFLALLRDLRRYRNGD